MPAAQPYLLLDARNHLIAGQLAIAIVIMALVRAVVYRAVFRAQRQRAHGFVQDLREFKIVKRALFFQRCHTNQVDGSGTAKDIIEAHLEGCCSSTQRK